MFPAYTPLDPTTAAHTAINFFSVWIARVGGVIAFIGMIKLALSLRSDDARESFTALLTAVSGFVIMSFVSSAFTVTPGVTAETEFNNMMLFISRWLRRAGALVLFLGSVSFGFSFKNTDAASKVTDLRTMAAGGIVIATALLWQTFCR